MRRSRFRGAVALGGLLLLGIGVWLMTTRDRISEENFKRIEKGMSLEDVEKIIGLPPGVYTDPATYHVPISGPIPKISVKDCLEFDSSYCPERKVWYGPSYWIRVELGPDGKVADKDIICVHHPFPLFDTVMKWLGW